MRTPARAALTWTEAGLLALEDEHHPGRGGGPDPDRWGALPYPMDAFTRLLSAAMGWLSLSRPVFCDLGAGAGAKVIAAAQRGCLAWGVEVNPVLAAAARENGADVRDGLAEDAGLSGADIVWKAGLYRTLAAERTLEALICDRMRPGAVLMAGSTPTPAGPAGWRQVTAEPQLARGAWVKP